MGSALGQLGGDHSFSSNLGGNAEPLLALVATVHGVEQVGAHYLGTVSTVLEGDAVTVLLVGEHLADLVLIGKTLGVVRIIIRITRLHFGEHFSELVIEFLDLVRHGSGQVLGFLNINAFAVFAVKLIEFKGLGPGVVDMVVVTHQLEAIHADRAF